MSRPFKFKQFSITQEVNTQKVGTDSMLLGAWVKGEYNRILDIGTGTGILALMLAQKNPNAQITAIEPHLDSLNEARLNFKESPFKSRILPVHAALQQFGAMEKFDLIICNPPYFENAFLSEDNNRNRARHTDGLQVYELYEGVSDLLHDNGTFAVIIPFEEEHGHFDRAVNEGLFPNKILRTIREDGQYKRSLITFSFQEKAPILSELLVKTAGNRYSKEYIELTKNFYLKDLLQE